MQYSDRIGILHRPVLQLDFVRPLVRPVASPRSPSPLPIFRSGKVDEVAALRQCSDLSRSTAETCSFIKADGSTP